MCSPGADYEVEIEVDLSHKKQLLDVVVIRRGEGKLPSSLPDGLDGLVEHNLLTFKSHQEPLTPWAIKELAGHYVNYRKKVSPALNALTAESEFRLFAVSARYPESLASAVEWEKISDGVYDCRWAVDTVRVIVTRELAKEPRNAVFHLFSAAPESVSYGVREYQRRSPDSSTLIEELLKHYQKEGVSVPYTMEDFRRDFKKEFVEELTLEERLAGLDPEAVARSLPPEKRLKGLPPEERLKGLTPEQIEAYLKKLRGEKPGSEPAGDK